MWNTLAIVAALGLVPAQAQAGEFALTNVRTTYGVLGQPRPDSKFLPGDAFVLSFDVEGLQANDKGKFLYRVAMQVVDGNGKVLFKQDPRDLEANDSLGGNTLPAYAQLNIGTDQPPGKYHMKVTVTDRSAKVSRSVTRSFEIMPKAFGLVRLRLTHDAEGATPAPFVGVGEFLWINFAAVGFGRDKEQKQPHLAVSLRVLDDSGRPTAPRPLTGEVTKGISSKLTTVPMQFVLDLNRAGKFTVEVKATDKITGETATLAFPLTVLKTK